MNVCVRFGLFFFCNPVNVEGLCGAEKGGARHLAKVKQHFMHWLCVHYAA